ncbi:acyl-CoA thioesterase [Desmospora profundinema]|uniref:YbgC/YbaW family acyl-CoA thioester hydrolase n=1 Tax=Desmospora profundinema TaxID=1571184 RepID=A0ABU1IH94_9BACL|nr:YbgC/YbaW family acyl-CoA thioester hydrolase [Desmospora profundinema]
MKHEFQLVVRSTDVDMIGHVNNAKYLEYMEWARFDWMKQLGLGMSQIQKRGLLPVVVHIGIDYRKELRLDDSVTVVTEPLRLGNKSSVVRQRILTEKGEVACEAEVTSVVIDAQTRRATEPPQEWKQIFESAVVHS